MEQIQYNSLFWKKDEDGTVTLTDARGILGSDPHTLEIPETVYENGEPLVVSKTDECAANCLEKSHIKRLYIPKTINDIYILFFHPLLNDLEEIVVDADNEVYAGVGPGLYSKDLTTLLAFPWDRQDYSCIPEQTVNFELFCYEDLDHRLIPERILKHIEKTVTIEDALEEEYLDGEKNGELRLRKFEPFADKERNVDLSQWTDEKPICYIGGAYGISSYWNRVILPNTVKYICDGAFRNSHIDSINLPNAVEEIGGCAFFPLNGAETLDLPDTVNVIEPHAFDGADKVKHIVLPRGIRSCNFLFNFENLETIEMKDSANGETNFIVEDGVLYSADKKELVKYLKTKKDKVFRVPDEVLTVIGGAFHGNPYLEKIIIPHHYTGTVEMNLPMHRDDEHMELVYDYFNEYYSALCSGNTYSAAHFNYEEWEKQNRNWLNPMFAGCTNLKALVYPDGTSAFGEDFDVVKEKLIRLTPFALIVDDDYFQGFFLIDGVVYWKDEDGEYQQLEHYPEEKKDEVFVLDPHTKHINWLENRFIKKFVIHNTDNEELFNNQSFDIPSVINLPALEEIEVVGKEGIYFVENGCLFKGDHDLVLAAAGKEELWLTEQKERQKEQQKKEEEHWKLVDGKHFFCPELEMGVRKSDDGRYFARIPKNNYHTWTEDFIDEDTGEDIKIERREWCGTIPSEEFELPADCYIAKWLEEEKLKATSEQLYNAMEPFCQKDE